MNLKATKEAVTPYLYSGALRVGVTDVVTVAREQIVARIPGERAAAVTEFLRTPVGEGLLRLALAGAIHGLPTPPRILLDAQDELLISASSGGFVALQDLLLSGAEAIQRRIGGTSC